MSKQNIISKLANVEIAPEDYTEGDKKHFTWDEAMEAAEKVGDGWRLPTRSELVLISEEFGTDESGLFSTEKLCGKLGLGLKGLYYNASSASSVGSGGYYWSSTAYDSTSAYRLDFNSSYAGTRNDNKRYGFSVRLVRDVATNEDDNYLEKGAKMKLRNKETGEAIDKLETIAYIQWSKKILMVYRNSRRQRIAREYNSLEDFNKEWEDYEEPKGIKSVGIIGSSVHIEMSSKEEAEAAVEKLLAWQRLKEAGFKFGGWTHTPITKSLAGYNLHIKAYTDKLADYMDDIQLLFGGEE